MRKTIVLAALSVLGCNSGGVKLPLTDGGVPPDFAGASCEQLDRTACAADSRCVLVPGCCCEPFRCLPAGSPVACNIACPASCDDPCSLLGEADCKANTSCTADYCNECSCTPTFVGCRLPSKPQTLCPPLGCPAQDCGNCNGLDQQTCDATPGCVSAFCPNCSSTPSYIGCFAEGQPQPICDPPPCPPPLQCRTMADCQQIGFCLPPGTSACSDGIPPSCQSDSNCTNGTVCADTRCYGKVCMQSCNFTGCDDGETCVNDRCVPISCGAGGTCPAHFSCAASTCVRDVCMVDGDCVGGGVCVEQGCYNTEGTCQHPAG
jgi:hypothetical protein